MFFSSVPSKRWGSMQIVQKLKLSCTVQVLFARNFKYLILRGATPSKNRPTIALWSGKTITRPLCWFCGIRKKKYKIMWNTFPRRMCEALLSALCSHPVTCLLIWTWHKSFHKWTRKGALQSLDWGKDDYVLTCSTPGYRMCGRKFASAGTFVESLLLLNKCKLSDSENCIFPLLNKRWRHLWRVQLHASF